MRINDWSSDVCSSDLVVGAAGAVVADVAQIIRIVRIRPLAIEQLLAAIIEAAEIGIVALLVDVADAAGEAKAILAGISALRNAALDAAGEPLELALGDDVDHARDRIRTRSEEHTSELQSLMRNSYSVFCLK